MARMPDCFVFITKVSGPKVKDGKAFADVTIDERELVMCRNCKHRFIDGDNVRVARCELNHNSLMPDDWYCADGEKGTYVDD